MPSRGLARAVRSGQPSPVPPPGCTVTASSPAAGLVLAIAFRLRHPLLASYASFRSDLCAELV